MKKWFFIGSGCLLVFEILNIFFIMPLPGSQRMNSIATAYFLYHYRWFFRVLFLLILVIGWFRWGSRKKWIPAAMAVLVTIIVYLLNFKMSADHMFYQADHLQMATASENKVDSQRLVIGIVVNHEARAYPVQFIGYHHQVADTIDGRPVIVTYCTVCRTGRVYEPLINGKPEKFRLVGMDHFNAMFEDAGTGSWWRQVNGEAIAGKLRGEKLPELYSSQTSLAKWLELHPSSKIMQADPGFRATYDSLSGFELGKGRSALTKTDTLSWQDKSWVIGIKVGENRKAYDWNRLKKERIILDQAGGQPVVVVLSRDEKSFFAFHRPTPETNYILLGDTLVQNQLKYLLNGTSIGNYPPLIPIPAYQEFWHSWRTFNPSTEK